MVRAGDICRMRPETEVKPLQNTRNIHQLINIEGRKYVVMTRNLSCFCKFCKLQNYQNCLNMEYVEPYETHELIHTAEVATSKQEQQNNNQEQQVQTERTSASREQYFNKKLKSLLNSENFSQMLEILVKEDTLSEYEELPNPAPQTFVNTALLIDGLSKDLVPDDIPLQPSLNMYPAQIYGDGNCLPRCASVIAFGDQDHHEEMRFRVVRELVIHKAFYMEDTNLLAGKHLSGNHLVSQTFASVSDCYNGGRLTKRVITSVYQKETLTITKSGRYMGMWQIASLASVLGRPLVSVCPKYGNHNVRADIHRVFYPRESHHEHVDPVFVMWTNIN